MGDSGWWVVKRGDIPKKQALEIADALWGLPIIDLDETGRMKYKNGDLCENVVMLLTTVQYWSSAEKLSSIYGLLGQDPGADLEDSLADQRAGAELWAKGNPAAWEMAKAVQSRVVCECVSSTDGSSALLIGSPEEILGCLKRLTDEYGEA
jgi:hypothetical protein